MNRLRNILLAVLVGCGMTAVLTSCGDDDSDYVASGQSISIVSNDLIFPAAGSTSTVQVQTAGAALEAAVDADWCSAHVDGFVVTVTAEPNYGFDGRTAILTLTSGSSTRQLPIQQLGMVLDMPMAVNAHYSPRAGEEFALPLAHNLPLVATSPQSWLHPEVDGNTLRIRVDGNDGGHIRRGVVVCECGDYVDTLRIAQFDMMDDVVGSYYMMGYFGGVGGTPSATRFDIIMRNDSLFMHWPQDLYAAAYIHIPIDRTDCSLFIPSGFVLRETAQSVVAGYFYDSEGSLATSSTVGATARLAYSSSTGFNSAPLQMANWAGHTLGGFVIRQTSFVSSNLMQLATPVLMRVGPVGTTIDDI